MDRKTLAGLGVLTLCLSAVLMDWIAGSPFKTAKQSRMMVKVLEPPTLEERLQNVQGILSRLLDRNASFSPDEWPDGDVITWDEAQEALRTILDPVAHSAKEEEG